MWIFKRRYYKLCIECKNILLEQKEYYLDYIKNMEESIFERILEK